MPLSEKHHFEEDKEEEKDEKEEEGLGEEGSKEEPASNNNSTDVNHEDNGHPGSKQEEEDTASAAAAAAVDSPTELPLYCVRPPLWLELSDGNRIDIHRPHKTHLGNVKAPDRSKKAGWWHAFSCSSDMPYHKVFCNICGAAIKVTYGSSTSAMLRHLRICNYDVYKFCAKINEAKKSETQERWKERKRKAIRSDEAKEAFLRSQADFARVANIPPEMFEHPSYKEMCENAVAREHLEHGRRKRTGGGDDDNGYDNDRKGPPVTSPATLGSKGSKGSKDSKDTNALAENLKYLAFGHLFYDRPIDSIDDEQAELAYEFCKDNAQLAGEILADGQEYRRRCENRNTELSAAEKIRLIVTVATKRAKRRQQPPADPVS